MRMYMESWERFRDFCNDCDMGCDLKSECHSLDSYVPLGVHHSDGVWTVFKYKCQCGHSWLCGYRTEGVRVIPS